MEFVLKSIRYVARSIRDLTKYHFTFFKKVNAYRGAYSSFPDALAAVPKSMGQHYDPQLYWSPLKKIEAGQKLTERFNSQDYPVVFWLKAIPLDNMTLLDLGGHVGLAYYTYRRYVDYPTTFRWLVHDLPDAVSAGEALAATIDEQCQLSFTADMKGAARPDILLTCGALQYLEKSMVTLVREMDAAPKHIIVHRVPFHDQHQFITLQNLGTTAVPYKVQNRQRFVDEIREMGYDLIDSWKNDRTCSIPFHPEYFVDGYSGFYFRRR